MKQFRCSCGGQLFFDNHQCLSCGVSIGFDPTRMEMVPLDECSDLSYCENGVTHGVCNWLRPRDSSHPLCIGCQFNRTIPNLSLGNNLTYWSALEEAKKRLFYSLMRLGLPLESGWNNPDTGLLFDFLEDARGDAEAYAGSFVSTGHFDGVITINVMEADQVVRTQLQVEMREHYRTLLGHFRHESGHYYWERMHPEDPIRLGFTGVFGDASQDYPGAIQRYYETGPRDDWPESYISAYASAHPAEDWAETWGHYLHIYDSLETAACQGFWSVDPADMTMNDRIAAWQELSISFNEVNRSMGRGDAYPFVISPVVASKLKFVDSVVSQLQTR